MKTLLLSFAFLATASAFNNLAAQCTVSPPVINNIQQSGCRFTFDLNFNLKGNGGNKITAIYIYSTADYNALPSNFYGQTNNNVPTSSDLNNAKALATIKINTDSTLTVYNYQKVASSYQRPSSMQSGLAYYVDPSGQITIKNISLTFTTCNTLISLKADVLSSQSPDLSSVGCIAKGLSFAPNEPIIQAADNGCGGTRSIAATFITTEARTVNFKIFKDVSPFNQFTADDTASANAVSPNYSTTTAYNSTTGDYRSDGNYAYTNPDNEQFSLWVVAYTTGVPNVSTAITGNKCVRSILPTVFASFSAQRHKQNVLLKWQTATEEDNKGFYVQRQKRDGEWQNLEFLASLAPNGSSANLVSYSFADYNAGEGVSQYRIQQVGLNGKVSYSEIRSVKSNEMAHKTVVYPNPSLDGKITLVFDAASLRNVILYDVSGRVVKKLTGVKENNVVIQNLTAGFYTIQVVDQATATISIEKVLIQSR